jgi:hypothetical protein
LLKTDKHTFLNLVAIAIVLFRKTILRKRTLDFAQERGIGRVIRQQHIAKEAHNNCESTFDDENPSLIE